MSFWKNLFGGGSGGEKPEARSPGEDYKGYTIRPALQRVGSEYQLAGEIEKTVDGEVKTYTFVRADRFSSREDAEVITLNKARQIIDEQGSQLFR